MIVEPIAAAITERSTPEHVLDSARVPTLKKETTNVAIARLLFKLAKTNIAITNIGGRN